MEISFCWRQRVAVFYLILLVSILSNLDFASATPHNEALSLSLIKRAEDVANTFEIPFNITMSNGEIYGFNCSIGTPPQSVHLGINVFRSDTQVSMNITKNPWAKFYNSTLSTSANPFLDSAELIYNSVSDFESPNANLYDVEYTIVSYATDTFSIPSATTKKANLKEVQFVAYSNTTFLNKNITSSAAGLDNFDYNYIGLGVASGQAIVQFIDTKPYPTFTQHFVDAGLIQSNTYSIWLDPVENRTGHLLLGGIDNFRYKDSLISLPTVLNTTSDPWGLKFQPVLTSSVDSISINGVAIKSSKIQHVALAHVPITVLEAGVARKVWDAVGAKYDARFNIDQITPTVPCSYLTNSSTLEIQFSKANFTLKVAMSDITTKSALLNSDTTNASPDTCVLLIRAVKLGLPSLLGTNVLRNLYTVYDLSNQVLSVALTDFSISSSSEENVISIPPGGIAAIPALAFKSKSESSRTTGSSSSNNSTSSGTSTPTKGINESSKKITAIAAGVAVPLVVVALGLVAAFFILRRRRVRRRAEKVEKDGKEGKVGSLKKSDGEGGYFGGGKAELPTTKTDDERVIKRGEELDGGGIGHRNGRIELSDEQQAKKTGELQGNPINEIDSRTRTAPDRRYELA